MNLKREKVVRGRAFWHALAAIGVMLGGLALLAGCSGRGVVSGDKWEKHITEETIYIEGVDREYTLLFITDTHMVVQDDGASDQEKENAAARFQEFMNQEGIPSAEQFPEWIRFANERKVDAVLLGGDIVDTPSQGNLKWLEEQLSQLEMPYLYVNGNHDWTFPWEYMTEAGRAAYLPLLEPFMNGNTTIQTLEFDGFTIVGIDDSTNQVDGGVLPVYEQILAQGRPVIVLAHVPFMTQSVLGKAVEVWGSPTVIGAGNFGGIYPNEDSESFVNLTTARNSPVELVLAGHVHFQDKDVMEGEKNVLQLVGGAGFQGNALLIHITNTK